MKRLSKKGRSIKKRVRETYFQNIPFDTNRLGIVFSLKETLKNDYNVDIENTYALTTAGPRVENSVNVHRMPIISFEVDEEVYQLQKEFKRNNPESKLDFFFGDIGQIDCLDNFLEERKNKISLINIDTCDSGDDKLYVTMKNVLDIGYIRNYFTKSFAFLFSFSGRSIEKGNKASKYLKKIKQRISVVFRKRKIKVFWNQQGSFPAVQAKFKSLENSKERSGAPQFYASAIFTDLRGAE